MSQRSTSTNTPRLRIVDDRVYVRNLFLRLPFRFGKATMVAVPLVHLRLIAEGASGRPVTGEAADILPPKWFDKDAAKSFEDNITDLFSAIAIAGQAYRFAAESPIAPFDAWCGASPKVKEIGALHGLNGLTAQFGSSLYERALIDASGKALGLRFHTMLRENALGIRGDEIFTELDGAHPAEAIPTQPPRSIFVRHTIGLGDALREGELLEEERRVKDLPVAVETWIREAGIRYFKIKVSGDIDADRERLERIQELLQECAPAHYAVTLDGNEQFADIPALQTWWDTLVQSNALSEFWPRVLYLEQPVERSHAFDIARDDVEALGDSFPPLLIDESDDAVERFQQAIDSGYRGVSHKNCKGVFKSVLNAMLIRKRNEDGPARYFLSGEDLTNQPIVPLQQDLCVTSALGIPHLERNGHHYAGTFEHLSESEMLSALDVHGSLYESHGSTARLRIQNGALDLSSLHGPGLGVAVETDYQCMTPVCDWQFASLRIE